MPGGNPSNSAHGEDDQSAADVLMGLHQGRSRVSNPASASNGRRIHGTRDGAGPARGGSDPDGGTPPQEDGEQGSSTGGSDETMGPNSGSNNSGDGTPTGHGGNGGAANSDRAGEMQTRVVADTRLLQRSFALHSFGGADTGHTASSDPGMSTHRLNASMQGGPHRDAYGGGHFTSAILHPRASHSTAQSDESGSQGTNTMHKETSLQLLQDCAPGGYSCGAGGGVSQGVTPSAGAAAGVFSSLISPHLLTAGGQQVSPQPPLGLPSRAQGPSSNTHPMHQQVQYSAQYHTGGGMQMQPPPSTQAKQTAPSSKTTPPTASPPGAPLPVKGKMEGWERLKVNEFVDSVRARHIIVSRGELARELRSFVNMARPQLFYEKLISRKRLNQELGPLLAPRRHRRGSVEVDVLESLKRNPDLFRAALEHHQQSQAAMLASQQAAAENVASTRNTTSSAHGATSANTLRQQQYLVAAAQPAPPLQQQQQPMQPQPTGFSHRAGAGYVIQGHGAGGVSQQWQGVVPVATSAGMMYMTPPQAQAYHMQGGNMGYFQAQQAGFLMPGGGMHPQMSMQQLHWMQQQQAATAQGATAHGMHIGGGQRVPGGSA